MLYCSVPFGTGITAESLREMEEEEIEKAVIAYLKKKGFKQTELAFHEEQQQQQSNKNNNSNNNNNYSSTNSNSSNSQTDPDIAKHILSFSSSEYVSLSLVSPFSLLLEFVYFYLSHKLYCFEFGVPLFYVKPTRAQDGWALMNSGLYMIENIKDSNMISRLGAEPVICWYK